VADDEIPNPDLSGFSQPTLWGDLTAGQLYAFAAVIIGEIGHATPPERVPLTILDAMGWDPVIRLAEAASTAPIRDTSIYYVMHKDPGWRALHQAWLEPILPKILGAAAAAYCWGSIPIVMEWKAGPLSARVSSDDGTKERSVRRGIFYRYDDVFDLHPAEAVVRADKETGRRLEELVVGTRTYGADRAFVAVYGREFGRWIGRGARRIAYRAWYRDQMVSLWHGRYLERSVDAPRIGRAPAGKVKVEGTDVQATNILTAALMSLKNGSAASLPSGRDANGNLLWDVSVLDLPDRSDVWEKALNRNDALKLLAYLVPPTTVGAEEATFSGGRIPADVYVEFVQSLANWVASDVITPILRVVHLANGGDPDDAPTCHANDLPRRRQKLLLDVFGMVANVERVLKDGRAVTMAELVGDELLRQLGLPMRSIAEAARAPRAAPGDVPAGSGTPGRPKSASGEREERRENARTEEGEQSVGKRGEGAGQGGT
jgi:hypothetical protein